MKNEKSDFRVVESNFLISGQYKMSLSETKLILCMFQKIDINDKDFQQYKIYLKDFIDLQDKKRKDIYAIADKLTDTFLQHIIRIKEKDGSITKTHFMASCNYKKNRGYITFDIHPKLKHHLLRLQEHFSSYDIRNIMNCHSIFAIRIYQILKTKEYLEVFQLSVDELKWMLKIENKYKLWADLRRYVLDAAKKDLDKYSDLQFSYKGIKEGRKIKHIEFHIKKQKQRRLFDGKDYIKNDEVIQLEKMTEKKLAYLKEQQEDSISIPDELKNRIG